MLSPDLLRKIEAVRIKSRRAVDAVMAGQYRSVFRGTGIEFEEVREYAPGDEVKSIDWKVTARMGRPFVKRFREERELSIMLLVDMSASGRFGTTEDLKRDKAAEIACVLAMSAIRNNDLVGAILFTDRVERHIPPKKGTAHVWRVVKEILEFTPERAGTDIAAAADFLGKVARKRCVAFVISDFQAADYLESLKRANRRHDCIAVCVTDPGDFALPEAGLLELEDLETGRRGLIDCSSRAMRQAWEAAQRARHAGALQGLARAKIDTIELATDGSSADALHGFFRYRESRVR